MKQLNIFLFLSILTAFLIGCQANEETLIDSTYSSEELKVLSNNLDMPTMPYSYSFGNLETGIELDHRGTLGRVLFYDKNLSSDGTVSCASCHQQALAFSDDKAFSDGPNGNITSRNSIALGAFRSFGMQYDETINEEELAHGLFWDERAESIKDQLRQTINNPNEMGMELHQIVDLVESKDYYRILHQKAFDSDEVTEDNILEALKIFINSINAVNSKLENEFLENLNYINGDYVTGVSEHKLGLQLFTNNCNTCHELNLNLLNDVPNTNPITVANNGLLQGQDDMGVYENTQNQEDIGKFKIPGLFNVELSAPYMHDGRFASLEEVVEFYSSGINFNQNLHPALREGNSAKRLNFTEEEKSALVTFLKTLTDENITTDEKWADPFLR